MKIVIVEDEPLAAERLSDMLLSLDATMEILGNPRSVKESVKLLSKEIPDLVFLDVQLSDGLCFEIFDKIVPRWPVIFTTAYDQYAIKAFKLHSIDYLLKPIKKDALASSLLKFHQAKRLFQSDVDMLSREISASAQTYKTRFLVETGQKIRTVDVGEIAYFMAHDKAVYLVLSSGQRIPVEYALDRLEQLMDPERFFRINRKFMITINSISSMTNYSRKRMKVVLNPATSEIADTLVSIEKAADFRHWLDR
jgi:DNA-binding LytR/AlgR family response regulator